MAAAQDDADGFDAKFTAAVADRCGSDAACVGRQRAAFDRLIGLEPGSAEELAFDACVGSPLPSDADWEKAERCVDRRMKAAPPLTNP